MFLTAQTSVRVSVILCQVEQTSRHTQELQMDSTTLIILVLVVLALGGGGFFYRGRA
jgi:hypothetical protein